MASNHFMEFKYSPVQTLSGDPGCLRFTRPKENNTHTNKKKQTQNDRKGICVFLQHCFVFMFVTAVFSKDHINCILSAH